MFIFAKSINGDINEQSFNASHPWALIQYKDNILPV